MEFNIEFGNVEFLYQKSYIIKYQSDTSSKFTIATALHVSDNGVMSAVSVKMVWWVQ